MSPKEEEINMNAKQISRTEKQNVVNYFNSLYDQRDNARANENMSLEIDTTNMLIGAKNVLRLLGLESLIL